MNDLQTQTFNYLQKNSKAIFINFILLNRKRLSKKLKFRQPEFISE